MRSPCVPAGHDRVLAMALGTSIVLHAVLLGVHFKFPNALRSPSAEPRLEVVLVNAKTRERPAKADVLAQANLDRGGTVDERRRARSPLPVTNPKKPGHDLALAERRVRELEARQQELLAMARASQARLAQQPPSAAPAEEAASRPSGRDLADLSLAAMRLQAQIDKQLDEYQQRPRKKFIGANAAEYRYAQYEEDWRAKVERVGTVNYPAEARGKLYGNLRLTVTIRPDGGVDSIELDRSSGLKILDGMVTEVEGLAGSFVERP